MSSVLVNPSCSNLVLRESLYAGDVVLFTELPAVAELVAHTREELNGLFDGQDPIHVHETLSPENLAAILSKWKPAFMRLDRSMTLARQIIEQCGFDPETTHFDLLKPRTSYPVGHLTTGIAYAFPWHRDTWYAAAPQQINLWLPIWEPQRNNAMAFDPMAFGKKVPNNSVDFDYYRRNVERGSLDKVVKKDTRAQPGAIDWNPENEDIYLPSPGSILLFSADQLHRSIPNTSGIARYSIDYRIVETTDIREGRGAPAIDNECTGTAIRDFNRVSDGADMPDEIVRIIEPVPPAGDVVLKFDPKSNSVNGSKSAG